MLIHLYGLFIQLYIVYANDYADYETDRLNRTFTMFSGGSRVLVEGLLTREELRFGAGLVIALNMTVGLLLTFFFERGLSLPFIVVSLVLLWMYSFAPVRLSYRGGGELLQMIGVGLVLPLFGYYAQSGTIRSFPWSYLLFILPAQLACAIATALPDYPSDRASNKKTGAVLLGPRRIQIAVIILNSLSIVLFMLMFTGAALPGASWYVTLIPLLCTLMMIMLLPASDAGSSRLKLFVTCAVASTVCLMGASASLLFYVPEVL